MDGRVWRVSPRSLRWSLILSKCHPHVVWRSPNLRRLELGGRSRQARRTGAGMVNGAARSSVTPFAGHCGWFHRQRAHPEFGRSGYQADCLFRACAKSRGTWMKRARRRRRRWSRSWPYFPTMKAPKACAISVTPVRTSLANGWVVLAPADSHFDGCDDQ